MNIDPAREYKAVCPHTECRTTMRTEMEIKSVPASGGHSQLLRYGQCTACGRLLVLLTLEMGQMGQGNFVNVVLFPQSTLRPIATEVTGAFRSDYLEASAVLNLSPKASAALSRRCLQHLLVEKAGAPNNAGLYDQIEGVIGSLELPTQLRDALHTVREIGNLAAHPKKNDETGLIVDVEPGEAEWNLDTLDALFDFYIVQPARTKVRQTALKKKLNKTK